MKHPRSIQVSIAKPCNQNWAEMSANEKGRHCVQCNKTVTDFTNWSDAELALFLSKHKSGICGRFKASQLYRPINIPHQPKSRLYRLAIAFGLTLMFTQVPEVHSKVKPMSEIFATFEEGTKPGMGPATGTATIEGYVLTSENNYIETSLVQLQRNDTVIKSVSTDVTGTFSFTDLEPGSYDIYIKCDPAGYQYVRQIHERITIGANDTIAIHAVIAKEEPVEYFIMGAYSASEDEVRGPNGGYYREARPLGSYLVIKDRNRSVAK